MKFKAEIFDKVQYLFNTTQYNDHQVHCVIRFTSKVEARIMKKAVEVLVKTVPLLTRVYRYDEGNSYWEDSATEELKDLFTLACNEDDFNSFTCSKTDEKTGPQIKVCLLQAERDSISIVMNHMVSDAAGFKRLLYLLSDIYSNLLINPDYTPDLVMDGDRSYRDITGGFRFTDKLKVFLFNTKDNNQSDNIYFPMSPDHTTAPFILIHEITPERYASIISFARRNAVTVNDVILSVYFRVLARFLNLYGVPFNISMMIDMRRYLENKSFKALANLSSTVIINAEISPEESFAQSISKIRESVNAKKANFLGLNTFLKLEALFKFRGQKQAYEHLEKSLNNPNIGITNIGILDSAKLVFDNSPISNAYMCGSIKYRPHFQMAVSTYKEQMTMSVNLYGSSEDRENIRRFFALLDDVLSLIEA